MTQFKVGDRVIITGNAAWLGPATVMDTWPEARVSVRRDEDGGPMAGQTGFFRTASLAPIPTAAELSSLRSVAEAAVAWKAVVGRRDPRFRLDVLALYDAVTAHEALCSACFDKRQAPTCAVCGGTMLAAPDGSVCYECALERKKAERQRAHAARVKAAIEEHRAEGAQFFYRGGCTWCECARVGVPSQPESVGWVRWTDAAGDVHTIEFQGAGNG